PFADALASMKKGQYTTTPVKSEFGYHVISIEDIRPLKVPSFNEMKSMLHKDAEAMMVEKIVTDLRTKAKIQ
ncbi:MAG: peptidylprolyl isomerase, partial [Formivibrio sp.]|nr:peptidylprolyl isomerase [Formivibrio sp.]